MAAVRWQTVNIYLFVQTSLPRRVRAAQVVARVIGYSSVHIYTVTGRDVTDPDNHLASDHPLTDIKNRTL